jgi:hypothetical protein
MCNLAGGLLGFINIFLGLLNSQDAPGNWRAVRLNCFIGKTKLRVLKVAGPVENCMSCANSAHISPFSADFQLFYSITRLKSLLVI